MGQIPVFTRTVLPQTEQGSGAIQLAGQQQDINAANLREAGQQINRIGNTVTEYKMREAQAMNAMAVNEGVISAKRQAVEMSDAMRRERQGNPKDFHKDFDSLMEKEHQKLIDTMPSQDARMALKQSLDGVRASVYEDNLSWENTRNIEIMAEQADRARENMNVLALRAGQNGKSIDDILRDAEASSVAVSTWATPEKAREFMLSSKREALGNYLEGLAESDPEKVKQILKSGKYDSIQGADEIQRLDGVADSEIKRRKAEGTLALQDDYDNMVDAMKMGLKMDSATGAAMLDRLKAAGLDKEAKKLNDYIGIQDSASKFAVLPFKEQENQIKSLTASIQSGNVSEVGKLAAFQDVLQTKQAAQQNNNLIEYYAAQGVIREPGELNFASAGGVAHELDQRRISAKQISDIEGFTPSLLSGAEAKALGDQIKDAETQDAASIIANLGAALQPDEYHSVARAVAPDNELVSAAMLVGDESVATGILQGAKIKAKIKPSDLSAGISEEIGHIFSDPAINEQAKASVSAYYKFLQFRKGADGESIDSDIMGKAISEVLGPVVEVDLKTGPGGVSKILSYRDEATGQWIADSRLEDILYGLTDEYIGKLGQKPMYHNADSILKKGRIVVNGDGLYSVYDVFGSIIKNEDGSDFTIDARKLDKLQRGAE